ncbi:MAG TPA: HXXEE domain-containing protein [Solirubrobacterales bacterium]|nr:HXXEE domain-containing protein [Solirubrobacterales bacterium]
MPTETHGRWPWAAAALVVPASVWACPRPPATDPDAWVARLALPILLAHQSEEWVRPGGFLPFCNRRLLGSDRDAWPLSERDGFHVNVTAGWGSAVAAALLWRRTAAPAAAVLWLEAGNAAMHSAMALRERRYNPGLATAALLMAPHAALGGRVLRRSGRLSRRGAMLAAAAGIGFSAALPLAMKLRMRAGAPGGEPPSLSPGRAGR